MQLAAVYPPFAQEIFGTAAFTAGQLAVGAGLPLAILVLMEIDKVFRRRSRLGAQDRGRPAADLA